MNVHLDGAYAFSLTLEVAMAAGLRPGLALDEAALGRLRADEDQQRAMDRALGFLSHRPRSRQEVHRYLAGKHVTPEVAASVVARLEATGLVDDAAFAAWWVENRGQHRPRGARALRQELGEKGVARDVQDQAVTDVDEAALATELAVVRARRYRGLARPDFDRRLGAFLARRGFGYDAVRPALDAAWVALGEPPEVTASEP